MAFIYFLLNEALILCPIFPKSLLTTHSSLRLSPLPQIFQSDYTPVTFLMQQQNTGTKAAKEAQVNAGSNSCIQAITAEK